MKNQSGSLYLLTGLVLGVFLGLAYTWFIQPEKAVDTAPSSLGAPLKDQYRALVATAFASTGDLVRARARLELLGDTDYYSSVLEQAGRKAVFGETGEVTALRLLAAALAQNPSAP